MTVLLNSQQPACKLPSEIIAEIIMLESAWLDRGQGDRVFRDGEHFHPADRSWIFTAFIKRCALLRTLCRAWRDAIDCNPNFTRYIFVNEGGDNILYVQRYNHHSLLECFLNPGDRLTRDELPFLLGPLTQRLYSLSINMTETTIEPAAFPILQVLRIFSHSSSLEGWGVDPLRMVHANPGLKVLVVDFPGNPFDNATVKKPSSPPLRVEHSGLRVVQLTGRWDPYKSDVLRSLGLDSSVQLVVDTVDPAWFQVPNSALKNMIASLQRKGESGIPRCQLEITVKRFGFHMVRFMWSETGRFLPSDPFSLLVNHHIASSGALLMVQELVESGIVETIRLYRDQDAGATEAGWISKRAIRQKLFRCLGSVKLLSFDVAFASWLLPALVEYRNHQFPCPNLTEIECFGELIIGTWWGGFKRNIPLADLPRSICKLIKTRQSRRSSGKKPAKLRRIVVSPKLMNANHFDDPIFDGVDIYSV
ncbi:hypothetical protein FRC00_009643 [Tulasnella sp. 408]|nr:hypothetical protein FRC00_009643 [Tulasnella sp. 408]